jgi:hypothetical protein
MNSETTRKKINKLTRFCEKSKLESKLTRRLLADLMAEHEIKDLGFKSVFDILHAISDNDVAILETAFNYKINSGDEMNKEATELVK